MPKQPAETVPVLIAGEPTEVAKHIVQAVPGAQRFSVFLQRERGCKPSTILQYLKVVGLHFHKQKKAPKGAVELTALQHYDKWRISEQGARWRKVVNMTGVSLEQVQDARIKDLKPVSLVMWRFLDQDIPIAVLHEISKCFYEAHGTDRAFANMDPDDFIFGAPYVPVVPPKPVQEIAIESFAALTQPRGLAHDYAVNAEAFVTDDADEFEAHLTTKTPDGILLSKSAVREDNHTKVMRSISELIRKWSLCT